MNQDNAANAGNQVNNAGTSSGKSPPKGQGNKDQINNLVNQGSDNNNATNYYTGTNQGNTGNQGNNQDNAGNSGNQVNNQGSTVEYQVNHNSYHLLPNLDLDLKLKTH
ncbi:hypothetical protein KSD_63050 [Ktedonobacter sp. SOSP1-85]|uniref:hypothetical protein n=1 Tax=Ktedonobacter sp. SOSP1-85 TaxID=2778367 RepID=UPI001914E599|nr:hypothetical protein [Ktedonobacter sp. SOSP1-85]GHO78534.1 hypothetical protein KSD_63050 [Ktedonobacter sp. SOSP1-85]